MFWLENRVFRDKVHSSFSSKMSMLTLAFTFVYHFLLPPFLCILILVLCLASFGKSLGIRRLYVKWLLKVFKVTISYLFLLQNLNCFHLSNSLRTLMWFFLYQMCFICRFGAFLSNVLSNYFHFFVQFAWNFIWSVFLAFFCHASFIQIKL